MARQDKNTAARGLHDLLRRINQSLKQIGAPKADVAPKARIDQAFTLLRDFDVLTGRLYTLRAATHPSDPTRLLAEDVVSALSQDISFLQADESRRSQSEGFLNRYRRVWREEFALFALCLYLFLAAALVGWNIGLTQPEYTLVIIPQALAEQIMEQQPWFESIQENPLLTGLGIAWNNIRVCITCFALSAVFGLGGLAILCFNGLLLGAIMGFCYLQQFNQQLTNFIVSHGILELSVIVASAFAGMLYGRVFCMRPYNLFKFRMRAGAQRAGLVLAGVVPWLCLAACFEAFVSPFNYLSFEAKLAAGLLLAIIFWGWTFAPGRDAQIPFS